MKKEQRFLIYGPSSNLTNFNVGGGAFAPQLDGRDMWQPNSELSLGEHTIKVRARDCAGNWSEIGTHTVTIIESEEVKTIPGISPRPVEPEEYAKLFGEGNVPENLCALSMYAKEGKYYLAPGTNIFGEAKSFSEAPEIFINCPCTNIIVVVYDSEEAANADCTDETINDVVYCSREFTTDLENYAHPLELSLNSDGTHVEFGGSKIEDVRTIESGVYVFDLSSTEEESLFYFCGEHSDMGNAVAYQCTELYQPTPTPTITISGDAPELPEIPETPTPIDEPGDSTPDDSFIAEDILSVAVPSDYTEESVDELLPILDFTNEYGGIASFTVESDVADKLEWKHTGEVGHGSNDEWISLGTEPSTTIDATADDIKKFKIRIKQGLLRTENNNVTLTFKVTPTDDFVINPALTVTTDVIIRVYKVCPSVDVEYSNVYTVGTNVNNVEDPSKSITFPYFGVDGSPYLTATGGGSDVVKIIDGWYYNIFLKEDGELWYTGITTEGGSQILSAFGITPECSPVSVKLASDVENIWGDGFSIHIKKKDDLKIYACGYDRGGKGSKFGIGDSGLGLSELKPVIGADDELPMENIKELYYNGSQVFYLTNSGEVYGSGHIGRIVHGEAYNSNHRPRNYYKASLIYSNETDPARKVIPQANYYAESISVLTENNNLYAKGYILPINNNISASKISHYNIFGDFVKYQENVEDAYTTQDGSSTFVIKKTDGYLYQSVGGANGYGYFYHSYYARFEKIVDSNGDGIADVYNIRGVLHSFRDSGAKYLVLHKYDGSVWKLSKNVYEQYKLKTGDVLEGVKYFSEGNPTYYINAFQLIYGQVPAEQSTTVSLR